MNNEPVAYVDPIWMDRPDLVMAHQLEIGKLFARTQFNNYVPLYTHPVKEQLTDEEINKLWAESSEDGIAMQQGFTTQQHYFAHLILRKGQEK